MDLSVVFTRIGVVWRALAGAADPALATIVADSFDGLVVVDEHGRIVASSTAACDILGVSGLGGRMATQVLPAVMLEAVRDLAASGRPGTPTHMALALLSEGSGGSEPVVAQFVATLSEVSAGFGRRRRLVSLTFWDVTERRRSEERLSFLATHDRLTGGLSRAGFCNAVNLFFGAEKGRAEGLTVLVIDLTRFKPVNDALGHAHGDMLLKQVVSRLKATGVAVVARLGGHGFAVAHPGIDADETARFCTLVLERLVEPYQLGSHRAIIGASVGISRSEDSGYDPEQLLGHADMALTVAHEMSGNAFAVFTPKMDDELRARQDMEAALQQAIERNEISVMFQPQVSLDTGALVGVEALMRWRHPELGMVSPDRFIPVAEETGRIVELGRWVLEAACAEVASWPIETRLSVNVSPVQFDLVDVAAEVAGALRRSGLSPSRLDVEITEGIFMSNTRAVTQALQKLRDFGVSIALDDFGTGYSSLSYLGRLPVDKIKIDQSFVKRLPADQEAGAIIRAVMTLSETLGKVVIAEGVETADQAWMLRMMGCKVGQGFHYGRPMTGEEMRALLGTERYAARA